MESKTKKTIISSLIVTILVISILGVSYAYFTANLTGVESASTIKLEAGEMNIAFAGGNTINVLNEFPKDEAVATKVFTITGTNTTDLSMYYRLSLIVETNTFSTDAIKYTLTSYNTSENGAVASSVATQTGIATSASAIDLGEGYFTKGDEKIHTYSLAIFFPKTETDQNAEQGKSLSAFVKIEDIKEPTE